MGPQLLVWGAVLAAPIVLYLFRRKPLKVRVSTLLFFKSLAREHQESAWLRRLKRLLSFLMSAAVVIFSTLALARLVVSPPTGSLRSVVVLIDRSASMAATDAEGTSRLEAAKAAVRARLSGLPGGVSVSIMAFDGRPEILLPRSLDRREVERALTSVEVRPIEGDAAAAVELARQLAALETPAAIWHATDSPSGIDDGPSAEAEPPFPSKEGMPGRGAMALESIDVSLESPTNAGITAFQLRRLPLVRGRYEAFVQVSGVSAGPFDAKLEMRLDGALVNVRELTIEPGASERLLVPVEAESGRTLSLEVRAEGDCLASDNEVHARVPEVRPLTVLWISPEPDPFTQLALTSLGDGAQIEVLAGKPSAWPPEETPDVAIFDGWAPDEWPRDVAAVVIDPPGSAEGPEGAATGATTRGGPVRSVRLERGVPLTSVRPTDERHPVLYGVATARVELTQTAVLESDGPLEPLWVGPSGPVLAAGDVRGQRVVAMAFAPSGSTRLPLMASFPLLLGNSIYWCASAGADGAEYGPGRVHRTGDLVECPGRTITWSVPVPRRARGGESGPPPSREVTLETGGALAELDRVGLWRPGLASAPGPALEEGAAAAILSTAESCLGRRGDRMDPGAEARAAEDSPGDSSSGGLSSEFLRGDLSPLLIWIVLGVLLLESYLFHRRAVY